MENNKNNNNPKQDNIFTTRTRPVRIYTDLYDKVKNLKKNRPVSEIASRLIEERLEQIEQENKNHNDKSRIGNEVHNTPRGVNRYPNRTNLTKEVF